MGDDLASAFASAGEGGDEDVSCFYYSAVASGEDGERVDFGGFAHGEGHEGGVLDEGGVPGG